jgi:hypothetical protein
MTRRPPRAPDPPSPPDEYEPPPKDPVAWQAWRKKYRAELRLSVRRKIAEWAELHLDCPIKGCRRNRTCLAPLACQSILFDQAYAAVVRAVDERARAAAREPETLPARKDAARDPSP